MTTDKEHLQWMLNRLSEVHGENKNVDYMMRLQQIIDNTETELNLRLVSKRFCLCKEPDENWDSGQTCFCGKCDKLVNAC